MAVTLKDAQDGSPAGLPLKVLAKLAVIDATTLNRILKPLEAAGLISSAPDSADRRVRLVTLTPAGRMKIAEALPLWKRAQMSMTERIGPEIAQALGGLLDLSSQKLQRGS